VDGEVLADASLYHIECHRSTDEYVLALGQQLTRCSDERNRVHKNIDNERSPGETVKRWLSGRSSKLPSLQRRLSELAEESKELGIDREHYARLLSNVYDYWLTYPPDWETRKSTTRAQNDGCENCSMPRGPLHVHHKIPVSRGGSHRLTNLKVLCEHCHSEAHNGQVFDYDHDHDLGAFGKRLIMLKQAIDNKQPVYFRYQKADGTKTTRTIDPREFKTVEWEMKPGQTLCIVGYCHLRKTDRTFAIKRMSGVKPAAVT
jgi:hypothetical protein